MAVWNGKFSNSFIVTVNNHACTNKASLQIRTRIAWLEALRLTIFADYTFCGKQYQKKLQ